MKTKNLNKLKADDSTIISHEVHDTHFSIRVICQWYKIDVWADFSIEDDDLIMEWNKYIFFKDVEDDMRIKKFQENLNVWQLVFDIGEQYLIDKKLIDEDDDGNWIKKV